LSVLFLLGGFNPERLGRCPADDKSVAVRAGLSLILVFSFTACAVAMALMVATGAAAVSPGIVVAALLAGAAVAVADHAIVQSLWATRGVEAARKRGLANSGASAGNTGFGEVFAAIIYGTLRIAFTFAGAFFIGTTMMFVLFAGDIRDQIEANDRRANAPIWERAERAVAERLAVLQADVARLDESIASVDAAIRLSSSMLISERLKVEAARRERLAALAEERDQLLRAAQAQEASRNAEQLGMRLDNSSEVLPVSKPARNGVFWG
jgi:MFS family permease